MDDNEPRYWFRAKRYGLGWGLPLAWQGWVIFLSWLLIFPVGLVFLTPANQPRRLLFILAMVALLLVIVYWKGDPRGRRWNNGEGNR